MSTPSEDFPNPARQSSRTLRQRMRALYERLRDYMHYHGLWAPGVRLLRRLSLRGKAVLLVSLMGVPTLWLVTDAALARWLAYRTATLSHQGVELYRDLWALERAAQDLAHARTPDPAADATQAAQQEEQARFAALQTHLLPWLERHPQGRADWQSLQQQRDAMLQSRRGANTQAPADVGESRRAIQAYLTDIQALNRDVQALWAPGVDGDADLRPLRLAATVLLPTLHASLGQLMDRGAQVFDGPDRFTQVHAMHTDLAQARLLLPVLRASLEISKVRGVLSDDEATAPIDALQAYLALSDRLIMLADTATSAADLGLGTGVDRATLLRQGQALRQSLQGLHGKVLDTLGRRTADAQAGVLTRGLREGLLLATLLGLVLYMQISFYKVIGGGLNILCRQLRELGRGNLSIRPQARGRDEVAQALDALGASAQHMSQVLEAVTQGVAAVSHASRDVATGNAGLSGRTGEMRNAIGGVSDRAQSFSGAMDRCGQAVEQATEHMHAMRADAQRSRKAMGGLRERMQALQTKSREIARVVEMVEAVAYQTKLLSLNASVEAARAGAAGRGFAVVAQEVRALAQRSEYATGKIHAIITSSIHEIEDGHLMTERASEAVRHTDEKIEAINRLMVDIVELTRSAVRESNEVLGITRDVEQSADGNARLVAQLSDASAALRSQGDSLKRSVQHFVFG
ncbi:MAG TPA: methyl-accepting chemotaxis protein [Burkholderiaceae bacterium]|nr:methyl-accepting chemotaxis protein [Burkholderiaceae bacterium]